VPDGSVTDEEGRVVTWLDHVTAAEYGIAQ
jgi:hypothetical protein